VGAQAEVRISGALDAITIEASEASLDELLAALNKAYGLQYRYPASLNRSISGTFTGPLPQVLARLLKGYDFVTETSEDGMRIAVYDFSAPSGAGATIVSAERADPPPRPARFFRPQRAQKREHGRPLPHGGRDPANPAHLDRSPSGE
jgi:hypothetical protein